MGYYLTFIHWKKNWGYKPRTEMSHHKKGFLWKPMEELAGLTIKSENKL